MLRGLIFVIGVFVLSSAIGAGVVLWQTQDTRTLSPTLIAAATTQATADATNAAAQVPEQTATADAPLGIPGLPAAAAAPAQGQTVPAKLEMYRGQAQQGLLTWLGLTSAAGLVCALTWTISAALRSSSVRTPSDMRSARPAWLLGLLTVFMLAGVVSAYVLKTDGLAKIISSPTITWGLALFFGLTLLGYYWATAFAATSNIRPSVPGAGLFIR